ncbi:MAG: TolC family protein [Planctomycetes bacterium]|nr:TolC family protein [Planctomycetota bacterium]
MVDARVDRLLADGLSVEEAVQVCLLNNPKLQASFFRVGMARADVLQSQLLNNPSVGVSARFPSGGGLVNVEAGIVQNLVDLWQIPVRKQIAENELNRVILEISHEASQLAADAKGAYYEAIAVDHLYEIARQNRRAAERLLRLTEMRRDAGAGSGVDVILSRSELQGVELSVRAARLDAFEARGRLTRTLGLTLAPSELQLVDPLPEPPGSSVSLDGLLQIAAENRLDLAAAHNEIQALASSVELERRRIFRVVQVGVEVEREARPRSSDGNVLGKTLRASLKAGELTLPPDLGADDDDSDIVVGPSLLIELPIFDRNRAQIAKAEFIHSGSRKRLRSLLLDIAHDVRLAHERARTTSGIARVYESELLPLRESSLELTREAYRVGKIPLVTVLQAQRTLQDAKAGQVQVLLDRALAWTDLERVTACPIDRITGSLQEQGKTATNESDREALDHGKRDDD